MSSSLFGSWSLDDAKAFGKIFKAKCHANYSSEHFLTKDKEYKVKVIEPILPMSPLCEVEGDNGKAYAVHLTRFTKLEEIES